ncbi:MAG: hypothetical protein ACRD9L_12600 [Bryobacteraceae bacterium]
MRYSLSMRRARKQRYQVPAKLRDEDLLDFAGGLMLGDEDSLRSSKSGGVFVREHDLRTGQGMLQGVHFRSLLASLGLRSSAVLRILVIRCDLGCR